MDRVLELINDSLVTVKALAVGETAPASMTTDALTKFNEVLEALSIQDLTIFTNLATTIPLVAGVANYTVGPTGGTVAARPQDIKAAFVTLNGFDFPVIEHSTEEYALIGLKNQPGLPEWLIYNPDYPNGTITLWPVPYLDSTLTIYTNKTFTAAATLFDIVDLPPGYRKMIRLMLAWELLSDYPGMTQAEIVKLDGDTKQAIALVKRANDDNPEVLRSEVADLDCSGGGNFGNWRAGA